MQRRAPCVVLHAYVDVLDHCQQLHREDAVHQARVVQRCLPLLVLDARVCAVLEALHEPDDVVALRGHDEALVYLHFLAFLVLIEPEEEVEHLVAAVLAAEVEEPLLQRHHDPQRPARDGVRLNAVPVGVRELVLRALRHDGAERLVGAVERRELRERALRGPEELHVEGRRVEVLVEVRGRDGVDGAPVVDLRGVRRGPDAVPEGALLLDRLPLEVGLDGAPQDVDERLVLELVVRRTELLQLRDAVRERQEDVVVLPLELLAKEQEEENELVAELRLEGEVDDPSNDLVESNNF